DFVRFDLWISDLGQLQNFGPAVLFKNYCFHLISIQGKARRQHEDDCYPWLRPAYLTAAHSGAPRFPDETIVFAPAASRCLALRLCRSTWRKAFGFPLNPLKQLLS